MERSVSTSTQDRTPPVSTVPALVDRAARLSHGDGIVLPAERVDFAQFAELTRTMARRLRAAGIGHGDRVGLLTTDRIESLAMLFGAMRIGAVPVPVNARYKARELSYVVANAGMRALLLDPSFASLLDDASLPASCRVVVGLDEPAFVAAGATVDDAELGRLEAAVQPDDSAIILYTSGTTASPKGCVYVHRGMTTQAFSYGSALELTADDRFWSPLPLFHVAGLVTLLACIAAPCPLVHVGRHFEPGPALDQLESERCTLAFPAFETIWLAVQNAPRFAEADLGSLRLVIAVGSPGSLRLMQERLPSVTQVSSFGSTECGGFVSIGRPTDPLEVRLTTNGRAFPGSELRIVDPETGEDLPPNTPGEILMRGPTRFVRYHEEPELTAEVIDADGWFHSGDLGRMDAEGRLSFAGRLKDMLKVGGENVAAAEIETYLLGHPACEIVQVVAAPDARYTEVAAAFVQLAPGATATEQELIDYCRGQIATFKVPRYIRFVDEWPMSGTKIQKFVLREQMAVELAAAGITEAPRITSR
jgi:fatty-acyl-CoA synthase